MTAWLRSARPASQLYLALGLAVGWSLALRDGARLDGVTLALLHAFGLFHQLFIVWANDVADEQTDRINTTATPFSGGSRVLVRGELTGSQLRRAAFVAAVMAQACALALSLRAGSPWPLLLGLAGALLLWAYSFAPIRLSYRGGGAWLQVAGLGVVLPLLAWASFAVTPSAHGLAVVGALLPAQFACAISTTLPDAPSDTESGKRSFAVVHGASATTLVATLCLLASVGLLAWLGAGLMVLLVIAGVLATKHALIDDAEPGSTRLTVRLAMIVGAALALQLAVVLR